MGARTDSAVMIFIDCATDDHILFMGRATARALHTRRLLQKIEGKSAYCAPRSWRQIAAGYTPPLSRDVLEHCYLTPKEALQ